MLYYPLWSTPQTCLQRVLGPVHMETFSCMRFCIVSSNELVVLDSLENSKQYKNEGKRFRVYGALDGIRSYPTQIWLWSITSQRYTAIWGAP